jgi:hypothetical protein
MNASAISDSPMDLEQSPIKSLSNLVSGPIKTSVQNLNRKNLFQPIYRSPTEPSTSSASDEICTDPISAKLTSCLCKRLNSTSSCNNNCEQSPSKSTTELEDHCYATSNEVTVEPSQSRSFLNRTSNNAISKPKPKQIIKRNVRMTDNSSDADLNGPITTSIDNPALAEASRNLTQTLRRLSKRVFTNRINLSEDSSRVRPAPSTHSNPQLSASNSGAVIESMKHHGKGIYSGTFSGTLNPALQDKYGRPKRDISTIIHILNDLLSATPQVAKSSSAKIYFDSINSGSSSSNTTQTTNNPASTSTSSAPVPPITPNGKFVKIKKQSLMRVLQSSPCIPCNPNDCSEAGPSTQQSSIAKICTYGQCNGHSKIEPSLCARTSSSSSKNCYVYSNNLIGKSEARKLPDMPLISQGPNNTDGCIECNQNMLKLEIENSKTKHKLDQLRLVMQQKKERREARKLKASPYNGKVPIPPNGASPIQAAPKFNDNSTINKNSINTSTTTTTSTTGSSTTATAIATPLTTNNETDLNHLAEEVDTAA